MQIRAMLRDVLEAVVLAVVLFLVLQFAFQNTIVEGSSMEPNLVDQEWLLVNKLAYRVGEPERGDVIVFHSPEQPEKDFIKRVVGLPGETVEIRRGRLYIDGEPLEEPWRPALDRANFAPYRVPAGQYFVLGDNRPSSNDSRIWKATGAALERDRIIGKAWISVWPRETWGRVPTDRPGPVQAAD